MPQQPKAEQIKHDILGERKPATLDHDGPGDRHDAGPPVGPAVGLREALPKLAGSAQHGARRFLVILPYNPKLEIEAASEDEARAVYLARCSIVRSDDPPKVEPAGE